jgi:hypothetical protein
LYRTRFLLIPFIVYEALFATVSLVLEQFCSEQASFITSFQDRDALATANMAALLLKWELKMTKIEWDRTEDWTAAWSSTHNSIGLFCISSTAAAATATATANVNATATATTAAATATTASY